jgi:outer membrane protein assembly factor BamB
LSSLKTLWQVPVPLPGWNSPIAFGNEIFLSGADAQHRAVYCFSATDGKLLWSKPAPALAAAPKQLSDDTGHAPSTMATDGLHVATIFINGDVYCFDRTGKQLWARNLGVPDNTYGHASSLQVYGSGLIVQMDQGADPTENKSTLSALDFATGKTVWQVKRPVQGSWSTPMIVHAGNADQLVTCATPWTIAYDPRNGKELWRANFLSGDVAPSPTFGGGYVYACNQGATLDAIRPGLSGNITTTGVAWSSTDGLPDIASPLDAGEIVFLASSEGALTAVDARTGKKLWEHDYDDGIKSSPLLVGTDVWVIDMTGTIHAIEPGPTFHETAKLALKETCDATPALLGNKVFIRTADHLICLAAPSAGQTQ